MPGSKGATEEASEVANKAPRLEVEQKRRDDKGSGQKKKAMTKRGPARKVFITRIQDAIKKKG